MVDDVPVDVLMVLGCDVIDPQQGHVEQELRQLRPEERGQVTLDNLLIMDRDVAAEIAAVVRLGDIPGACRLEFEPVA